MTAAHTTQYIRDMQLMYTKILQKIGLAQQLSEMDTKFLEIYKSTLEKQVFAKN